MSKTVGLFGGCLGAAWAIAFGGSAPAYAAQTVQFKEVTTSVIFQDGGAPGRSEGDVLIYTADLLDPNTGELVGTKSGRCTTTFREWDGDFIGECSETISLPGGTLNVWGSMNQTGLERWERQSLRIHSGTGSYASRSGGEVIDQTRYPDEFLITLTIR